MASGSASPASVSSRLQPIVSSLGLSASSGSGELSIGAGGAPAGANPGPAAGFAVPWRKPGSSRKALWRKRKAFRKQQAAAGGARPRSSRSPASSPERREIPADLFGLCFNCFREGHRREDCWFPPLCIQCGLEGHISTDCKRPRSPRSEEDLRRDAVAKVARASQPSMQAGPANRLSLATRQATPLERPSPVPADIAPVGSGQASAAAAATGSICVLRRTQETEDLEQRLRLAVVAYVGGTRPAVSCQEATEALSEELRIPRHRFSVHKYHPEDFLVVFAAPELRNRALAAGTVEHGFFKLFVKPWLKL
ncbi:uncharacterized protein [Aegilops tauschii subsp. strangulata]|uniref:uncharacterized protein n=1 Tax=Aegilops tauschii subsp. strangulata TaxID=200361 RepID=UPI00098AFCD7|nr:uncharacterized protein LOC123493872 [Aegilops tauschii subsp. strangulata]